MRTRKVIALSLLSAGAAFLFSGCPNQPPGPCVVARAFASQIEGTNPGANYVLQYYFLNEAPGSNCAAASTADPAVAAWPAGNFVGALWAEAYGPVTAIDKLTGLVPEEFGWTNSFTGDYVECSPITDGPTCLDNPIILGNFTTDTEDVNGTCTIQGNDAGVQVVNGVLVTYNFPSTLVLVQSEAGEGTQIQATVQITRQSAIPGTPPCIRNYTALGFWPTAICNVNNDCNPLPQPDNTPPRPIGSGLLPGIPFTCSNTLVPQDPIVVPGAYYADPNGAYQGCGTPLADGGVGDSPFILQTGGCCGGAKNNNAIADNVGSGPDQPTQSGLCFYADPSVSTFPYLTSQ
jgi:hypothetical protein